MRVWSKEMSTTAIPRDEQLTVDESDEHNRTDRDLLDRLKRRKFLAGVGVLGAAALGAVGLTRTGIDTEFAGSNEIVVFNGQNASSLITLVSQPVLWYQYALEQSVSTGDVSGALGTFQFLPPHLRDSALVGVPTDRALFGEVQ